MRHGMNKMVALRRGDEAKAVDLHDALRRGDEAKAVGLIDSVKEAAHLGLCLVTACETGHPECTRLLLAAHAVVDRAERNDPAPLMAACINGHGGCVRLLLAAHAVVDQADGNGATPLYAACIKGHGGCVQLLLAAHAVVDQAASNGCTPLYAACDKGHGGCVQLLLHAHADVDKSTSDGVMPLYAACINGYGGCVQLLLAAHAVVDQADINGTTPLINACAAGAMDIVKLLVHAGARIDLRSASGTALDVAEVRGHTIIARFLRSRRRAPATIAAAAPVSVAERAAAERAAELAAAALLAEEEAEVAHKQRAQKKKASKKATVKQAGASEARAPAASASAAVSGSAEADNEVLAAAGDEDGASPAPSAAADEALRVAMAAAQYEGLVGAIEEHHALASEGVLAEARAMRERLHKKRKQESQKLRRNHAVEMEMQASLSKLSLHKVTQSPPAAGSASTAAAPASEAPEAPSAPPAAVALTLAELTAATDGFGEQRLIGSGGYGRVFTADALSSLPLWLRHKPVAVKRAKSGVHELADLQREVSVLQQCGHPHMLPLLGNCLEHGAPPCLVFPLMRGGSLANRLWPKEADLEHLRRLGIGASLSPLMWHQRLRILRQATDALLYLHTPVPGGKGRRPSRLQAREHPARRRAQRLPRRHGLRQDGRRPRGVKDEERVECPLPDPRISRPGHRPGARVFGSDRWLGAWHHNACGIH